MTRRYDTTLFSRQPVQKSKRWSRTVGAVCHEIDDSWMESTDPDEGEEPTNPKFYGGRYGTIMVT